MKKVFALVTVIALTVVLSAGAFAQVNLDRLFVNANELGSDSPNLYSKKLIVIDPGDKIFILGWAIKNGTNLDKVYYKVDGKEMECDGTDSYIPRDDVAGFLGIPGEFGQRSAVGSNTSMMELLGIDELKEGEYTVEIIARFLDETPPLSRQGTGQ